MSRPNRLRCQSRGGVEISRERHSPSRRLPHVHWAEEAVSTQSGDHEERWAFPVQLRQLSTDVLLNVALLVTLLPDFMKVLSMWTAGKCTKARNFLPCLFKPTPLFYWAVLRDVKTSWSKRTLADECEKSKEENTLSAKKVVEKRVSTSVYEINKGPAVHVHNNQRDRCSRSTSGLSFKAFKVLSLPVPFCRSKVR